jgi:Tol biopolymer transport system component
MPFALTAAAAALAGALVTALLPRDKAVPPEPMQRYVVGSADLQSTSAPMLSPDGSFIVFSARDGVTRRLYRRQLSSFDVSAIEGTDDGMAPFFSPDGAWLGFVTTDGIRKVPIAGGLAQTVVNEQRVDACDWGRDGTIYFTPRSGGSDGLTALARVPSTGGKPVVVAAIDTTIGEAESWLPEILPDGKTVIVTMNSRLGNPWKIVAFRPDGSRHTVVENGLLGRYARPGYLLYFDFDSRAVLAAPFDAKKAQIIGPAVPLTEQVEDNNGFDVSDDGKLVYVPVPGAGEGEEIIWLDRKGAATVAMDTKSTWMQPRVSPDGRRVLLRKSGTNCELWLLDAVTGGLGRVTQAGDNHDAIWSPDGRRILCLQQGGTNRMAAFTVEGPREVTTVAEAGGSGSPQSWSPAGNLMAYTMNGRGTRSDIWVRVMDGTSPPAAFLATEFNETDPAISPDGAWIAYVSNEAGSPEVFIRRYPDTGTTWQVSTGGGGGPVWARDGSELFFVSGTKMMAAAVETRPALRLGNPVELFDGGFSVARSRDYDVTPDGRFVALRAAGKGSGRKELRMLLNWRQGLTNATAVGH